MGYWQNVFTWALFLFILVVNVILVREVIAANFLMTAGLYAVVTIISICYFGFIIWMIWYRIFHLPDVIVSSLVPQEEVELPSK